MEASWKDERVAEGLETVKRGKSGGKCVPCQWSRGTQSPMVLNVVH